MLAAPDGNAFSFSRDGKYVAVSHDNFGGNTKTSTIVYEVATGKLISQVELLHNFKVRALLSGNGKVLVSLGQYLSTSGAGEPPGKAQEINQTIQMWDATTGKEIRKLRNEAGGIFLNVAFSPDGKQITATTSGGGLLFFDLATGKEVRRLAGRRNGGAFLALRPTARRWPSARPMVSCRPGTPSPASDARCTTPRRAYGRLIYTNEGKLLAFGPQGQSIYVWDVLAEKSLTPTGGHQSAIAAIRFAGDNKGLITAASDGSVCFWDAAGKETNRLQLGAEEVTFAPDPIANSNGVLLSPDGKHALAATQNGLILFELAKGHGVCLFASGAGLDRATAAFSPDGRRVVLGSRGSSGHKSPLRLYDAESGQELRQFDGSLDNIGGLAVSPNGQSIAAVSSNLQRGRSAEVRLWETATGKSLWHQERKQLVLQKLAFAPDGKTLATLEQTGVMTLFDTANGRERRSIGGGFGTGNPAAFGFSPDGRLLAVGTQDLAGRKTRVRLYEVITGTVRHEFSGHDGQITALAFSPDSKRLATGSNDTTVLVWDLTGRIGEEAAKGKLTAEETAKLWTSLSDSDARAAHRALRRLADSPEETLALLTKQIQSGGKDVETDSIAKLIAALDSDVFEERQKAASDLATLGKTAAPTLKKALADKPSAEARRAITELLEKLSDKGGLPPEQVRPLRVVELLENLGSPEAKKLLETLAKGRAEAPATAAAKEAAKRLERGAKP